MAIVPIFTNISHTISISTGSLPRKPFSRFMPRSSSSIDLASEVSMGNIRNETSFIISVIIPPIPTIMTGPNWGSFCTPTINSTPLGTICSNSIPFTDAVFERRLFISLNTSLASEVFCTPTFTPPTSVLCRISGETTFITIGKPTFLAADDTSFFDVTKAYFGMSTPYFSKISFDNSSVITL